MDPSQAYIALSLIVLAVIALLVFFVKKGAKEESLTPLAGLAFAFVLAGILFGEDRILGYSLMGIGVVLAVVDIIKKSKEADAHKRSK